LDTLCGYYGVEDEDELPQEIQEISIGEMFEAGTAIEDIRVKMVQSGIFFFLIMCAFFGLPSPSQLNNTHGFFFSIFHMSIFFKIRLYDVHRRVN
jgi:hypothetical protein